MLIMKGSEVAEGMKPELLSQLEALKSRGINPALAVVRVGAKSSDLAYERGILKRFENLGLSVKVYELPENTTQDNFNSEFAKINGDKNIHGILLFRPLPGNLSDEYARKIISSAKDVDCMNFENIAKVFAGVPDGFAPCTAGAVMEMLSHYDIQLEGKNAAVVGRSMVIGRPVAMILTAKNATVTICHTKTKNIAEICRNSDIVIAAAGKACMINADYVNEHSVIIDVGININSEGKLCGDVDFENVSKIVRAVSPVPGGVGAVTTSVLAKNLLKAAKILA